MNKHSFSRDMIAAIAKFENRCLKKAMSLMGKRPRQWVCDHGERRFNGKFRVYKFPKGFVLVDTSDRHADFFEDPEDEEHFVEQVQDVLARLWKIRARTFYGSAARQSPLTPNEMSAHILAGGHVYLGQDATSSSSSSSSGSPSSFSSSKKKRKTALIQTLIVITEATKSFIVVQVRRLF